MKKLLSGLAVLVVLLGAFVLYRNSIEPADLWTKTGTFAGCPEGANCVSSASENESHRVAPIGFSSDVENVRGILEAAVLSTPGAHIESAGDQYLHVIYASPPLGLRDDVELLISPAVYIDVRAVSRLGIGSDRALRERVETLRAAFDARRGGN